MTNRLSTPIGYSTSIGQALYYRTLTIAGQGLKGQPVDFHDLFRPVTISLLEDSVEKS